MNSTPSSVVNVPTRLSQPPLARLIAAYSTSCTSVDLPDPLTPVTQVSVFSGMLMSMSFRLCSLAPSSRIFCPVPRRRVVGTGIASSCRRYFDVSERGSRISAVERAGKHDAPALLAGAEAEIDDVIGDLDHVGVVLDDEHGVALIAQLPQDVDQPQVVARVQADRRLVEHVQRADERRAERRRQVDALRLAARQRRRQPIERQVVEPDVAQERQPPADLLQHLLGDRRFLLGQLERREEVLRLADRQRRHLVDGAARDPDVARLAPQPRAAAVRAGQIAAIAAQEHADVHLVFLPLEPAEESADAVVRLAVPFDDEALLLVGQLATTARRAGACAFFAARFSSASCAR